MGFGTPSEAKLAFDQLYEIVQHLELTISQKKLVPPSIKVTCRGVVIDTKEETVSIPPEKISQIKESILLWQSKATCTCKQLQSLLGRGHGGRVVTLSPPTSAAGVRSPSWP